MQFSYKSHSFAVCGIQETCTKMRACTWLFTVCRTAATWGSSARLLGQGCVPVSWVLDGAGSALCSCELGRWMHQTCFRQVLQNLCEVAPQWLLLSCPWGASQQLPSSQEPWLWRLLCSLPTPSHLLAQTIPCVDSAPAPWSSCTALCLSCHWRFSCWAFVLLPSAPTITQNLPLFSLACRIFISQPVAFWRQLFRVRLVGTNRSWAGFLLFVLGLFCFILGEGGWVWGWFFGFFLQVALRKIFLDKGNFTARCFLKLFSSLTLNQLLLFQSLQATAGQEGTGTSRGFVQTFVHLCNM